MFLHGQDTVTTGESEAQMKIQAANLKLRFKCIIPFGALRAFARVPVFLYYCVDVFRPNLFHAPSPYPFLLLAFSLFLCYHGTKSSPFAAGRAVGVLLRPAVEKYKIGIYRCL